MNGQWIVPPIALLEMDDWLQFTHALARRIRMSGRLSVVTSARAALQA